MPEVITRAGKLSALSHTQMDDNLEVTAGGVTAVTSDATTIAVTKQGETIQCSIAGSGTITLPTLSAATAVDTDSWQVTIKNINATSLTVEGNGAETIDGAANIVLEENQAYTFQLDYGASEWAKISDSLNILSANNTFAGSNTFSVATEFDASVYFAKGSDIASAAGLTLGTDGNYFDVSGTTTITSIDTWSVGGVVKLHFDGALMLTHHATDLILPDGVNITTVAGDEYEFIEYATGDWRMTVTSARHLKAYTDLKSEASEYDPTDNSLTGTTETVVYTYAIAANLLQNIAGEWARKLRLSFVHDHVNQNAGVSTVRITVTLDGVGGTDIFNSGNIASPDGTLTGLEVEILATNASGTQLCNSRVMWGQDADLNQNFIPQITETTADMTGSIDLVITLDHNSVSGESKVYGIIVELI